MADDTNTAEREAAERWLRDRYGAYRGHFAWRELEEAFLAGRASLAASAGSEPVESDGWLHQDGLLYRLTDERRPCNRDEINVTMADGSRSIESRSRRALELLDRIRATHPSPPEGMAGWKPIETAPKYTEHGVRQHLLLGYAPDEIHEDGFVSQGYWIEAEEDAPDNMGHDGGWVDVHFDFFSCGRSFGAEAYRSAGTQPTHWKPLPAPPIPASEAKEL